MLKFEFLATDDPEDDIARSIVIVGDEEYDEGEPNWYIPIDLWSRKQYAENWLKALGEIEASGKSAFIMLADSVEPDGSFECFKAWKISGAYIFQKSWMFQDEIDEPIDINQIWKYVEKSPCPETEEINISQEEVDELRLSLTSFINQ